MFRVNRGGVQVTVLIHGKLMDIDCYFFYPAEHLTRFLVQDRQVAHFIAGVDPVAVSCEAQGRNVSPLIDVFSVRCETLDSMNTVFIGLGTVFFYLTGFGHVIMKVTAA